MGAGKVAPGQPQPSESTLSSEDSSIRPLEVPMSDLEVAVRDNARIIHVSIHSRFAIQDLTMNSVVSDAVNDEPLSSALTKALDAYSSTAQDLFKAFSDHRSASALLPANLLHHLTTIDEHLALLLSKADEHVQTQARIEELLRRIRAYDSTWKEDVREAQRWKLVLDAAVVEGGKDRERIRQTEAAQLDPDSILAYSRRIANYTSVPPHGRARRAEGQPIDWNAIWRLKGTQFPWPDDAKLTSGWLAETLLANKAAVGETQGIDTALAASEVRERRLPPQSQLPPASMVPGEDSEDDFEIDLL